MATDIDGAAKVLVSSIVGALVVYFVGDALTYSPDVVNGTGFEEGTATAEIIGIAPLLLVAFGLYGAFTYM